jgi:SAM-dependent methyltransferase
MPNGTRRARGSRSPIAASAGCVLEPSQDLYAPQTWFSEARAVGQLARERANKPKSTLRCLRPTLLRQQQAGHSSLDKRYFAACYIEELVALVDSAGSVLCSIADIEWYLIGIDRLDVDYERIYQYRFKNVRSAVRRGVWVQVAAFLSRRFGNPERVLDPAAGSGEFIASVPARERWAVDLVDHGLSGLTGVKVQIGSIMEADLPRDHFDLIFVSNFLEHLPTPGAVARFLSKMRMLVRPGGRLVIMGPNFRYCVREYFDCADHVLALTHRSVAEHLHGAGFVVDDVIPRFLPYSFRPILPPWPWLIHCYLAFSPAWRILGKQFLVSGKKPVSAAAASTHGSAVLGLVTNGNEVSASWS